MSWEGVQFSIMLGPEFKHYPPGSPEIVSIGDEFQLFHPTSPYINIYIDEWGNTDFTEVKILELPQMPDMVFLTRVAPFRQDSIGIFTPFNPEIGYSISSEDFDFHERLKKYESTTPLFASEAFDLAPNTLYICSADQWNITKVKDPRMRDFLAEKVDDFQDWLSADSNQEFMRSLQLTLTFPSCKLASEVNESVLADSTRDDDPSIYFDMFYPLDTGPIPLEMEEDEEVMVPSNFNLYEGLFVNVPNNLGDITQVSGRFSFR